MALNSIAYKKKPVKITTKTTTKVIKGWPPKRRAEQAARLRRTKIWLKSTGPKSTLGKKRVSKNAYKHGMDTKECMLQMKILRLLLKVQRASFKEIRRKHYFDYILFCKQIKMAKAKAKAKSSKNKS